MNNNETVAVIGLGYVGLPLALAFGKRFKTIGFDISSEKIRAYIKGYDPTGEMSPEVFQDSKEVTFTTDENHIALADYVLLTVPTPVDSNFQPDLTPLELATEIVGRNIKKKAIVIIESTVYPGVTEEICAPILETVSGLKCGEDFFMAYSPERINPGDKVHVLENIVKVVSGQNQETLERVASLYEQVIDAGVYLAPSIKVAEAAKVIENTQRDLNIALVNELAIIFDKMDLDTIEVLDAAGSKWNFQPFKPGLVGGHCIGVDPYYLTYKAEALGYKPNVILSGRETNDSISGFIVDKTINELRAADVKAEDAKIVVFGITFKENCPDIRNSKAIDVVLKLKERGCLVQAYDPFVTENLTIEDHEIKVTKWEEIMEDADAIIFNVAHNDFIKKSTKELLSCVKANGVVIDVKSMLDRDKIISQGYKFWRL